MRKTIVVNMIDGDKVVVAIDGLHMKATSQHDRRENEQRVIELVNRCVSKLVELETGERLESRITEIDD